MMQSSLDSFFQHVKTQGYVPSLVLKEINVSWKDRDWYLHPQDFVYLDEDLAAILVERGMARKVEVLP